jgi:hypothetical protein
MVDDVVHHFIVKELVFGRNYVQAKRTLIDKEICVQRKNIVLGVPTLLYFGNHCSIRLAFRNLLA